MQAVWRKKILGMFQFIKTKARRYAHVISVFFHPPGKDSVVFIFHSCGSFAGMERNTLNLTRLINGDAYNIVVAAHRGPYWKVFKEQVPQVLLRRFPVYGRGLLRFVRMIVFLRKVNARKVVWLYNQVGDFSFSESFAAFLYTRGDVFIDHHNFPKSYESFDKMINSMPAILRSFMRYMQRIDFAIQHAMVRRIITISDDVKNELVQAWGLPDKKITTYRRGVDLGLFFHEESQKAGIKAQYGCPEEAVLFLSVVRFSEEKRIDRLLGSFLLLLRANTSARLLILGNGPLKGMFEKRIFKNRLLRDNVTLLGHQQNVHEIIRGSDFMLLASDKEGQSTVIKEVMASGVIPVVTRTPGSGELIGDVLISERDVFAYARKIRQVIAIKKEGLGQIKRALINEIHQNYNEKLCSAELLNGLGIPAKDGPLLGAPL